MSTADIATTMRDRLALLAGERRWSDTREAWLMRAARASGLKYARVRAIWYGEVDRFWWDEVQSVSEAANKRRQELQEIGARNAAIRLAITRNNPVRTNVGVSHEARAAMGREGGKAERAELDEGKPAIRAAASRPPQ